MYLFILLTLIPTPTMFARAILQGVSDDESMAMAAEALRMAGGETALRGLGHGQVTETRTVVFKRQDLQAIMQRQRQQREQKRQRERK